jgi:hypothetical protein
MKKFKYNDQIFNSEWELRNGLRNISFPELTDENESEVCALLGIEVINEPDPEVSPEVTEETELEYAKRVREAAVKEIKVKVDGLVFDGDEISQDRMNRVLRVAEASGMTSISWVLADNTIVEVTKDQLERALTAAMLKQKDLWLVPYQNQEEKVNE